MLAIDCSKLEGNPTGVGRWLLNILERWPNDFPVRLYFRREIPRYDLLQHKNWKLVTDAPQLWRRSEIGNWKFASRIDPLWRHFVLPRALKRDKISLLFEPFYIPLLTFPPAKTVLCVADISYKRRPEWLPWRSQLRWFPDRFVKRVRHIFTISEFSKREIMDYYGIPEDRITVTPLAVDEKFRPRDTEYEIPHMKYSLFWGDLNTRRHPQEMIAAFIRSQKSEVRCQMSFVIVGRDSTRPPQNVGRLIRAANTTLGREAITHYEYLRDDALLRLIQGATSAIYLSDYEGFGLPVIEAMACGTPVITSRTSSLPEVGGEAAYYVEDNTNVGEIARALQTLADDQSLREELRAKGLERARVFSWEKTAAATISVLRELMV